MTKSTSRSEQSVPQMQFELRRMLEEATGVKLTSIEDCSKELLAARVWCMPGLRPSLAELRRPLRLRTDRRPHSRTV